MINKIKKHSQYTSATAWLKLLSIAGIGQIAIQGIGFLSGILIIRMLPVEEYALYTLSNTVLGVITMLGDAGISAGTMAEGGKVWDDKEKLGVVMATGLNLRKKFGIVSLLSVVPVLIYLLIQNGASGLMTVLIAISLLPPFFANLSSSMYVIGPRLHNCILPLQKNEIFVNIGRLFLTVITVFIYPFTFLIILAGGIPRVLGNIELKKITRNFVIPDQKSD